jgi:hypothetical protein
VWHDHRPPINLLHRAELVFADGRHDAIVHEAGAMIRAARQLQDALPRPAPIEQVLPVISKLTAGQALSMLTIQTLNY